MKWMRKIRDIIKNTDRFKLSDKRWHIIKFTFCTLTSVWILSTLFSCGILSVCLYLHREYYKQSRAPLGSDNVWSVGDLYGEIRWQSHRGVEELSSEAGNVWALETLIFLCQLNWTGFAILRRCCVTPGYRESLG